MAPTSSSPPSYQDIARTKIKHWIASTGITQTQICQQIGRNQPWLSRYLAGGIDADVDTLAAMAKVFEQNLFALLSVPADPDEAAVLRTYRSLRPEARKAVQMMLKAMSRDDGPARSRG
jgi:transcriptional regulator with XRE-family HTH domain